MFLSSLVSYFLIITYIKFNHQTTKIIYEITQLIILCYNPDSNRGARGAPVSFSAARPRNEHGLEW